MAKAIVACGRGDYCRSKGTDCSDCCGRLGCSCSYCCDLFDCADSGLMLWHLFSSEDTGFEQTMQQVVSEINTEYQNQLEGIKSFV